LNRSHTTTKAISLFLVFILTAGTIAAFSPSFMVGTAHAQLYHDGMDNNYEKSYGKHVSVKSIKCNNINANVNGLELDVLPPFLTGLISDGERGEGQYGDNSYESHGEDRPLGSHTDFKFICINNNNNTVVVGPNSPPPLPPGNPPPVPPEGNANLRVIKHVINDNGGTGTASDFIMSLQPFSLVENQCKPNPFSAHPSFPGSESGTNVPLLVPDEGICYRVSEDFNPQEIGDYDSSDVGCGGIIRPGETKTCIWTNNDSPNPSG
jgi:hypothetical protein